MKAEGLSSSLTTPLADLLVHVRTAPPSPPPEMLHGDCSEAWVWKPQRGSHPQPLGGAPQISA